MTVSSPEPGEWRLLADIDPDNRVMIVTDLKLEVAPTPRHLFAGEPLALKAALTEYGELIDRTDFLAMMRFTATMGHGASHALLEAGNGHYHLQWPEEIALGEQTLRIHVDGRTFEREVRRRLEVAAAPVQLTLSALPADSGHRITLTPAVPWIEPDSLSAQLALAPLDATYYAVRSEDGALIWDLPPAAEPQNATVRVSGRTSSGRAFAVELAPVELPALASAPEAAPARNVNWLIVISMLTIANLALFGIIAVCYLLYRERRPALPDFPVPPEASPAPQPSDEVPA